jgi:hypothetical protein
MCHCIRENLHEKVRFRSLDVSDVLLNIRVEIRYGPHGRIHGAFEGIFEGVQETPVPAKKPSQFF